MSHNDITYSTPVSEAFYKDCIGHSVSIKFDKMPDNSWCRVVSDKALDWALQNTNKIISSFFILKKHTLKDEDIRWGTDKHIEVNIEFRDENSTYILSIEISIRHLEYFIGSYTLNSN